MFDYWYTTVNVAISSSVLCLLLHHTKFATCKLYNNIFVKSTNQFLQ